MKTNKPKRAKLWRIFWRSSPIACDPLLIFNLARFNFAAGCAQLMAKQQSEQFG